MDRRTSAEGRPCADQIRQLGFNPDVLTLAEQTELLALHADLEPEGKPLDPKESDATVPAARIRAHGDPAAQRHPIGR